MGCAAEPSMWVASAMNLANLLLFWDFTTAKQQWTGLISSNKECYSGQLSSLRSQIKTEHKSGIYMWAKRKKKKKKWNSNTIRWAEKYYQVTPHTHLSDDDRQIFICDMLMMICDIRLCYLQLSSILSCCSYSRTLHISLRSRIL